jgi:predicted histone-like DNA-binding protein
MPFIEKYLHNPNKFCTFVTSKGRTDLQPNWGTNFSWRADDCNPVSAQNCLSSAREKIFYLLLTIKTSRKIMALKVKAVERLVKFNKDDAGTYRYVMTPELYIALNQSKVIREAALRSGVSQGVMKACWDAAGEVIKAWATEGHSVALPGLGTMRFGLRAKSVEKVEDVKAGLISSRRIVFTPTQDLKNELAATAIQITCYDRDGEIVKRVTSADAGTVEDPESDNTGTDTGNGSSTGTDDNGGKPNQGGSEEP